MGHRERQRRGFIVAWGIAPGPTKASLGTLCAVEQSSVYSLWRIVGGAVEECAGAERSGAGYGARNFEERGTGVADDDVGVTQHQFAI
ncbi:MAG: hypothetical protein ACFCU3_04495 [Verrucomicrobiales bacterium]